MDWHKLQHKLFEMDPTDPREDLAKLQSALQSNAPIQAEPKIDYLRESAKVAEGSLSLDKDYSVNDFAALAGVTLNEKQKYGDYAKGSDPKPEAKPGRTKHPLKDKLVGDSTDNDASRYKELEERVAALETLILEMAKKKSAAPKERNPHNQDLQALRKSGAMGAHKDKSKELPRKQKHKNKNYMESLQDELMNLLNKK